MCVFVNAPPLAALNYFRFNTTMLYECMHPHPYNKIITLKSLLYIVEQSWSLSLNSHRHSIHDIRPFKVTQTILESHWEKGCRRYRHDPSCRVWHLELPKLSPKSPHKARASHFVIVKYTLTGRYKTKQTTYRLCGVMADNSPTCSNNNK